LRDQVRLGLLIGLAILLVGALIFRLYGITFGLPHLYYWDEPTVVRRAIRFGSGDLNPHFFYYPALYMYVTAAVSGMVFVVGVLIGQFSGVQDFGSQFFVDPTAIYLAARAVTALIGTACVFLTYRVGVRYFSRPAGLLGALFLAVSVVHATHAHIAITDIPQSFFIIAAYLPFYWIVQRGRWRDYMLCGLFIGLGMATKYLAVFLVPSVLLAHFFSPTTSPGAVRHWPRLIGVWFSPKLLAVAIALIGGFFVGSPYNLLRFNEFVSDYQRQSILSAGAGAGTSYGYFLTDVLPGAFGWPLYLVSVAGLVALAWQRRPVYWVFGLFPLVYIGFIGRYPLGYARYMIPVEPVLALTAGFALALAFRQIRWKVARQKATAGLVMVTLMLITLPAYTTMRWNVLMAHEADSRTVALQWAEANLPAGTQVAVQSLFNRTFFNVPLMTDQRLAEIDRYIPQSPRFDAVRTRVFETLKRQPIYREVPFVYDFQALKRAGVTFVFISNQNWAAIVNGTANPGSPEARFKTDLETGAVLVKRFAPGTDLGSALPFVHPSIFPQLPPEISIYQIKQ
jgi:4-amino-4-deoxy-L-arabinose transferase-like glycosyltransferase